MLLACLNYFAGVIYFIYFLNGNCSRLRPDQMPLAALRECGLTKKYEYTGEARNKQDTKD